jgi:hypothetical protein
LVKFTSSTEIGDTNISDDGTLVSINSDTQVNGALTISGETLSTFVNKSTTSTNGTNVVSSDATGSYTAAFYNYTISKGSNARSGQISSVWNGSSIVYNETSTVDIGSTNGAYFTVSLGSGNVQLNFTSDGGWAFKTSTTLL